MNIEDFRTYCLSFKGVHDKMPFGKATSEYDRNLLVFYVLDKWFCFVNIDTFDFCNIKCMTGSGLKFRLWCCEKHPRVTMTKPNSMVCLDSCLEVFLNPYPDFTRDYLNFEMNATGTLLLQKGPDRAHRSFVNLAVPHYPQVHAWQLPDVWGVELEVPFAFLQQIYGPAAPALPQNPVGNFYQCSGPPQERYACWSSPHSPHPDFHRPDAFREIPFSR